MTRKEKHRLLAKLAGVPWQFGCPECDGTYFGSSMRDIKEHNLMQRHCHDQHRGRCNWSGTSEECRRTADYDKDHNAWVTIRLALDGKCLWGEFIEERERTAPLKKSDLAWWTWWFLNDLPGQADAAIFVLEESSSSDHRHSSGNCSQDST